MKNAAAVVAALLPLIAGSSLHAACYGVGGNERLGNYCAINAIDNAIIDIDTARLIDFRLKREGYAQGLGLQTGVEQFTGSLSLTPTIQYSNNINGGNPPGPLVLGNLSFEGNPDNYRKSGLLAGLQAGLSGRHIHGEGRYFNYAVVAGYAKSPKHGSGVATSSANLCSINHISSWWFVDACASWMRTRKDLSDDKSRNLSLTVRHNFRGSGDVYRQASAGINAYSDNEYTQKQLVLGLDSIHPGGNFSGFEVMLGEPVDKTLVTRLSVSAKLGTVVAQKPLTLSVGMSNASGGLLFGYERSERTYSVSAAYPVGKHLRAQFGYKSTDSTIDYFDASTPTFGLQFASVSF